MNNQFKKIELLKHVLVYKNLLDYNQDLIDLLNSSKTFHNCSTWCEHENNLGPVVDAAYLHSFRELKRGNLINGFSVEFNHKKFFEWGKNTTNTFDNSKNIFLKKERQEIESKLLSNIIKLKHETLIDYINTYKDDDFWPVPLEKIKEMSQPNNPNDYSQFSFFKYDYVPSEWPLLDFHTDATTTGPEHIISTMFYLNDNYDEGEIKFITAENKIICYKPKAGDIIVFPSFFPYFHSANYPINGSRYTIRTSLDLQPGSYSLNNIRFEEYATENLLEKIKNKTEMVYIDGRYI